MNERSRRRGLGLRLKAKAAAIAISTLPVLALGGATYYASERFIEQQVREAARSNSPNLAEINDQAVLLEQLRKGVAIGTGAVALLAAAIAIWLTERSLRPVLNAAETASELAERLRRDEGETGIAFDYNGNNQLIALNADLYLLAAQMTDLLKQQEAEGERSQLLTDITLRVREASDLNELLAIANHTSEQSVAVANSFAYLLEVASDLKASTERLEVD